MLSIFIFYSNDRIDQFKIMSSCLKDISGYESCQKILLVDDQESNIHPEDFEIHTIKRSGEFNWATMWEAGVKYSKHEICWYLDSDRVLPKNYMNLILDNICDYRFIYTSNLFEFNSYVDLDYCKSLKDIELGKIKKDFYKYNLKFDPRFKLPLYGSGKNPMSGNVAFTKKTYLESGGVDKSYESHGAFADTDFHMQCYKLGYEFLDLGTLELHLKHSKGLTDEQLNVLCVNNMTKYCKKWGLPLPNGSRKRIFY